MASLFQKASRSFLNTFLYIWSLLKAIFTLRAPPSYRNASRASFLADRQNDLEWGGSWGLYDTSWKVEPLNPDVMTEARLQALRCKAVNTVMTEDALQIGLIRQAPAFTRPPTPDTGNRRSHKRVFYDISLGEPSSPTKSLLSKSISDPFSISIYSGDGHVECIPASKPIVSSTPPPPKCTRPRGHKRSVLDTISSINQVLDSQGPKDLPPLPFPPLAFPKSVRSNVPPPKSGPPPLPLPPPPSPQTAHFNFNQNTMVCAPADPPVTPSRKNSIPDEGRRSPSLRRVPAYKNLHMEKDRPPSSTGHRHSISNRSTIYDTSATSPLRITKRKITPDVPAPAPIPTPAPRTLLHNKPVQAQTQASPVASPIPRQPIQEPDPALPPAEVLGKVKAVFDGLRAHDQVIDTREAMSRESYWTNATHGTSACGNDSSLDDSVIGSSSSSSESESDSDSKTNSPDSSIKAVSEAESGGEEKANEGRNLEEENGAESESESVAESEEEYGNEIPPRQDTPPMPYPRLSLSPSPAFDISFREDELRSLRLDSPLSALTFSFAVGNNTPELGDSFNGEQSPASMLSPTFPLTPLPSTDLAYLQKDPSTSLSGTGPRESANSTMQDIITSFEDLVSTMGPRYQARLGQKVSEEEHKLPLERSSLAYGYHAYAGVSEDCVAEWYDVLQLDNYA